MTLRKLLMHFDNPEILVSVNTISSVAGSLKTIRELCTKPGFAINEGMKTVINWKLRQDNVLEVIVT